MVLLFIGILLPAISIAQEVIIDTSLNQSISPVLGADEPTAVVKDTLKKNGKDSVKKVFEPNPKKAGLYSAIIPGLGQVYDRKYWKVPFIYAGLGVGGYFIKFNSDKYRLYRKAYISRRDSDPNNDELTELYTNPDDLKQLQDEHRKYMDISIMLTGVFYTAQIIDAIVAAHLKNFDISRNISMQMKPTAGANYVGMGLVFTFK